MTALWTEQGGSPEESWSGGASQTSRTILCAWEDRYEVRDEFLGTAYNSGGGTLYCESVNISPFGGSRKDGDTSFCTYEKARVTLNYKSISGAEQGSPGGTLYSESLEPVTEYLTMPSAAFQWHDDTVLTGVVPIDDMEAPAMRVFSGNYKITYYNLASVPTSILSLADCVNDAAITARSIGLTFGQHTLLLQLPVTSRSVKIGSANRWQVDLTLTYRAATWYKYPRIKGDGTLSWEYMYDKKTDEIVRQYESASFAPLMAL